MNGKDIQKPSVTNLVHFDGLTDEMADVSVTPPLSDDFFEKATRRKPQPTVEVTVKIEPDVLAWFKAQGADYEQRLSAALRLYADAHRNSMMTSEQLPEKAEPSIAQPNAQPTDTVSISSIDDLDDDAIEAAWKANGWKQHDIFKGDPDAFALFDEIEEERARYRVGNE